MFRTADLVDEHLEDVHSCETPLRQFGGRTAFAGRIRTVQTYEDNALVRETLATPGDGAVLVVDGGGSLRRALVGDLLAGLGVTNGWNGIVLYACVRDSEALAALDIGIKALGTNPMKSEKSGRGTVDIPVSFGGVRFVPGAFLYSDADGILVSTKNLIA